MEKKTIEVFTDGCCFPNPGKGGWGWVVMNGECGYGGDKRTTNQVMELMAVREAVKNLYIPGVKLKVISDSQYAINCVTNWCKKWKINGWKNGKGHPIKNKELILEIIKLIEGKEIEFQWVKGHSGVSGNEEADKLAKIGSGVSEEEAKKYEAMWH